MWRLLAITCLLSTCAWAQLATMDQIPTVRQSRSGDASAPVSLAYTNPVVAGNVLVALFHTRANIAAPTASDTLGSTWTLQMTQGTTNTWVYTFTATAAGSGPDNVSITQVGGTTMKMAVLEIAHVAELVDTTATAGAPVGAGSVTMPNITTTHYRTFVLEILCSAIAGGGSGASGGYTAASVLNYQTLTRNTFYLQSKLSGNPGVVTGSTITTPTVTAAASEGVIALRSRSALTITTPAIPDAVNGSPYSFQMQAADGAGTNVWTTTAGTFPTGLSLSAGGVISGTPSGSNGNTITFKVTDSAAATATVGLTVQVASSINTPALIQSIGSSLNSVTLGGVVVGHTLILGIANNTNFAQSLFWTPLVTDNCGTTYAQIPGAVTNLVAAEYYTQIYWGFGTAGGTCKVVTGLSTAQVWFEEWSNLQPIFDTGVVALFNANAGGSPITSGSITVPTTNEMLYTMGMPQTGAATIAPVAPFISSTNFGTNPKEQAAYQTGVAAGAATSSFTVSGNTSNNSAIMLFGLRPTTNGTAPVSSARGARSQVY